MRKFKCTDCGEIFTENESGTSHELVGEFWGAPAYNDYMACPRCGSTDLEDYYEDEDEDEDQEEEE